jgi:hypothetical protein
MDSVSPSRERSCGTRKTLSISFVAACVGCSLIYETGPLTEGGDAPGKPSAGFSGSTGTGAGTSVGGTSSGGTSSGTAGSASATGGAAGAGQNGDAGSAGDTTGSAGADGEGGAPALDCSSTYYPDSDGDGWGNEDMSGVDCETPGYAPGGDCADDDPFNNPGNAEYCDGVDNDCIAGTPDACPSDCVPAAYGNHAYLFCVGYLSQPQARAVCAQHGMRLVRLDDAAEQTWVNSWHLQEPPQHSWTGGSDAEVEGTWSWEDGELFRDQGVNVGYSDWGSSEPNNSGGNEHCMLLHNGDYWDDRDCNQPFEFTCERY